MYEAIIHSPMRHRHVNVLNKNEFLLLKAVLRVRIRTKFGISWVIGAGSESGSDSRRQMKKLRVLKSLCFFRRTVGSSLSLWPSKMIRFRDPDSPKKPASESGFSDTGLSTLVGNIRSVPLFLLIFL
jgi:hypothetical protein